MSESSVTTYVEGRLFVSLAYHRLLVGCRAFLSAVSFKSMACPDMWIVCSLMPSHPSL